MAALHRTDSPPPDARERYEPVRFCSRCGRREEPAAREGDGGAPPEPPRLPQRVCRRCGMGMMLSCAPDALPDGEAFAIVTAELRVSAVSGPGERILGREADVVGEPVLGLITSPLGDELLARSVGRAAQRASEPVVMPVLLQSSRARTVGTLAARVSTCGPPRAALVAMEATGFGRR